MLNDTSSRTRGIQSTGGGGEEGEGRKKGRGGREGGRVRELCSKVKVSKAAPSSLLRFLHVSTLYPQHCLCVYTTSVNVLHSLLPTHMYVYIHTESGEYPGNHVESDDSQQPAETPQEPGQRLVGRMLSFKHLLKRDQ